MKKTLFSTLFVAVFAFSAMATTLHVGQNQTFLTLAPAAAAAEPGDTILMHGGTFAGGVTIQNLKGEADKWITIQNAAGETVIFEGGTNAIQFIEPAFLHVVGLIFQHQTGNGVNTDDGGTYETPAHHVIFERCIFRDMSATGNNDLLKLSGLDHFEIRDCRFENGAAGGSGIDMVGCHDGLISGNHFEALGSNSIQCKGGSERVRIEQNWFENGGARAVNLGGNTGLAFFRPDTAHFEAARIQVFSNVFIGSEAPVAFVGSVEVDVANNTIFEPKKWVTRILQETLDPDRFVECGDNFFRNNLIFLRNNVSTATNIGPNTRPETFVFSNNLWFNADNLNWSGPFLPVAETGQILNADPIFADAAAGDFSINLASPAAGAGLFLAEPKRDFLNLFFANPPSIGAFEASPVSSVSPPETEFETGFFDLKNEELKIFPNPAEQFVWAEFELKKASETAFEWLDAQGRRLAFLPQKTCPELVSGRLDAGAHRVFLMLPKTGDGLYFLKIWADGKAVAARVVLVKK